MPEQELQPTEEFGTVDGERIDATTAEVVAAK